MNFEQQHLERGKILGKLNRHKEALEEYFKCLNYSPNNDAAFWYIAISYMKISDYKNSIVFIEKYIAINPQVGLGYYNKALTLVYLNEPIEAENLIKIAITLNPSDHRFWAFWSKLCISVNRFEEALAHAEKGLSIDPEDVVCLNRKIEALIGLGRTQDAEDMAKIVLSIAPENPYVHISVGKSSLASENTENAKTHFREALSIKPTLSIAQSGLEDAINMKKWLEQKQKRQKTIIITIVKLLATLGLLYWLLSTYLSR